ncbi:MAG: hypothetical protein HXY34_05900 [Candidatus Thorarchaeota archaeon]|nr:hypothetical protein [Candidatus Thorarchaeota archaeon]
MDSRHVALERLLAVMIVVLFAVMGSMALSTGLSTDLGQIEFMTQFALAVPFLTATSIAVASYFAMFFAQQKRLGDLIMSVVSLDLGVDSFLHMLAHRGSQYSRFFELSAHKSDLLLMTGYLAAVVGTLCYSILESKVATRRQQILVILLGVVALPVTSLIILFQPIQALLLLYETQFALLRTGLLVSIAVLTAVSLGYGLLKWKSRKHTVPTGIEALLVFMLAALLIKMTQTSDFQVAELLTVSPVLFGFIVLAVSLLGTSMIDPLWRK